MEYAGGRCHLCVYKPRQNLCVLLLPSQENAFVQGFASAAAVREEVVPLFINVNELAVFKTTVLGVN